MSLVRRSGPNSGAQVREGAHCGAHFGGPPSESFRGTRIAQHKAINLHRVTHTHWAPFTATRALKLNSPGPEEAAVSEAKEKMAAELTLAWCERSLKSLNDFRDT